MKRLIDIINTDNEPNIINDMVFGDDNLKNNNMKQTAVEWLVEQLAPSVSLQQKYIDELLEQAKEMERQQFIDFHIECMEKGLEVDGGEWKEFYLPKITDVAIKQFDSIFKA
jgi:hypothetical protein